MRIEQLRHEFELDVRYTLFPLHPETPEEGMTLHDLFQGRFDINAIMMRLRSVSSELGLPFGDRIRTFNSRNAQELGKWAEVQGMVEPFHQAVYQAYFVDGKNIARIEVLLELAGNLGLDRVSAEQALHEHRFAEAVDADWQRARDMGITAVPTVIYRGRQLVGFRPYEDFRNLVSSPKPSREGMP